MVHCVEVDLQGALKTTVTIEPLFSAEQVRLQQPQNSKVGSVQNHVRGEVGPEG